MMNQQVMPPQRGGRGAIGRMTQDLGFAQPPRISTEGKRFALVDAGGNSLSATLVDQQVGYYLDVVIADANEHKSKIFWGVDKTYSPNNADVPLCFSDNGIAPSTNAMNPQAVSCATCPQNVIGSAVSKISGAPMRACQDRKKLAVMVIGAPDDSLYLLNISPASLGNLRAYGSWLAKNNYNTADVITRIYFDGQSTGGNSLLFNAIGEVPDKYVALVDHIAESGAADSITGRDDVPRPMDMPLAIAGPRQSQQQLPPPQPQPTYAPPVSQFTPQPQGAPPAPQFPPPTPQQQTAFGQQQTPPPASAGPPAPKSRRGGARAGAGRPPEQPQAPQLQAAPVAPFAPQPQALAQHYPPPPSTAPVDPGPGISAFLQRAQQQNGPAPMPPSAQPGPQFGMQTPAAPDAATQTALKAAFAFQPPPPRQ